MWLRDFIAKDFWLKLFSLAVAVLIWVTVSIAIQQENTGNVRTFPDLPVLVVSSSADVHEFRAQPDHVEIEVRGPPSVLSKLMEKDMRVTVDLPSVESAQSSRKRVDVSTPPGVTLVRVFPTDVDVLAPAKP